MTPKLVVAVAVTVAAAVVVAAVKKTTVQTRMKTWTLTITKMLLLIDQNRLDQ